MRKIPDIIALQRGRSRGFSLVEILVAAAIGIIASLAIFQVFAVFEGQKRTTTSGGEAQTSGTLALFTVERELRQAGYGINNLEFLGCKIKGLDSATGIAYNPDPCDPNNPLHLCNFELIPVKITQGALGAPDTITVMYGNGELLPNPANFTQNMPNESSDYKVSNRYGFEEGNIVIAAEAGPKPNCPEPLCCTLAQVSNLPGALGQTENVIHNPGTYTDPATGTQKDIRYNPSAFPPGTGITYTTNAKLFNIGGLPANNIYGVQKYCTDATLVTCTLSATPTGLFVVPAPVGQLMQQQALFAPIPPAPTPLYDGIVQLQAQYGKDTNNNGVVDVFDEITPVNAAQWAQVLAVRVAVVARSGLYEKDEVSPATIRLWEDSGAAPTTIGPVWTLTADDRHYRYKVFQTVVPIRNMIWRP